MSANGSTRKWRILQAQVIREEPYCRLGLPGCTTTSTTADHIIPLSMRPDLRYVRSNLQGACRSCNLKRGNTPMSAVRDMYPVEDRQPQALGFFGAG